MHVASNNYMDLKTEVNTKLYKLYMVKTEVSLN